MIEESRRMGDEPDNVKQEKLPLGSKDAESAGRDRTWTSKWADQYEQRRNVDEKLASIDGLDQLRELAEACDRCPLRNGCKQVVFGEGNPSAGLVFIGEAPGADEDRLGRPFVGRAGKLLNRMLKAADLQRSEVYITNVVKCRPPNNRTPKRQERARCMPYLRHQMRLISPSIIIALGAAATQSLIHPKARITRMRGSWQKWEGIPVMPMFHPAALLRDPGKKKPTWRDIQAVLKELERVDD